MHTGVWTGSKMIIWGGFNSSSFGDGGIFDPVAGTWTAIPAGTPSYPGVRYLHTATWTGSRMIIWGGYTGSFEYPNGSMFDPDTGTWTDVPPGTPNSPSARQSHTATWTGSRMIIWGGFTITPFGPVAGGASFDPNTGAWTSIPAGAPNSPAARFVPLVWTGSRLIVWAGGTGGGGAYDNGSIYNPETGVWTAIPTGIGEPSARGNHVAIWTGSKMVVWGGQVGGTVATGDGGIFDPETSTWSPLAGGLTNEPGPRWYTSGIWTGSRLLVWGGYDGGGATGNGGILTPFYPPW
jgi:hypothetical protein